MSDFTIEQLEALKEGTTPGPWGHTSLGYEAEKYPVYGDVPGDEVALVRRQDWELVSAAPDLVDALIAEKQAHAKLRAEVEKLRDRKRSLSKTQYQTARDLKNGIFDETFGTMPETHTVEAWEMGARSNQRTATALTQILEGNA